jgi:hypothetical protein
MKNRREYLLGNNITEEDPEEATDRFLDREFPDLSGLNRKYPDLKTYQSIPCPPKFVPEGFVFKKLGNKVKIPTFMQIVR